MKKSNNLEIMRVALATVVCLSCFGGTAFADPQSGNGGNSQDNKSKIHVVVGKVTKKADSPQGNGPKHDAPKDSQDNKDGQKPAH